MNLNKTAYALTLIVFTFGCGEDVSTSDLSKLKDVSSQPKKDEPPPPDNPFGGQDTSPSPAPTGYGGVPQTQPQNTYGQPAPIVLYSELLAQQSVATGTATNERFGEMAATIGTQPFGVYFSTRDRITYIQVTDGLNKYRALNNKYPPTIEEFVRAILDEAAIKLPELSPGEYYAYDPAAKDVDTVLRVVQPAK